MNWSSHRSHSLTVGERGNDTMENAVPQSLARIIVHLVFSTKNRCAYITPDLQPEAFAYMSGILREAGCICMQVGGTADHVHLLFGLSRTITVAALVEKLKTATTRWIKAKAPTQAWFQWQAGYGAFSVGQDDTSAVVHYIMGQAEHHRHATFQEEYRDLLQRHGVPVDERYVWD